MPESAFRCHVSLQKQTRELISSVNRFELLAIELKAQRSTTELNTPNLRSILYLSKDMKVFAPLSSVGGLGER